MNIVERLEPVKPAEALASWKGGKRLLVQNAEACPGSSGLVAPCWPQGSSARPKA